MKYTAEAVFAYFIWMQLVKHNAWSVSDRHLLQRSASAVTPKYKKIPSLDKCRLPNLRRNKSHSCVPPSTMCFTPAMYSVRYTITNSLCPYRRHSHWVIWSPFKVLVAKVRAKITSTRFNSCYWKRKSPILHYKVQVPPHPPNYPFLSASMWF